MPNTLRDDMAIAMRNVFHNPSVFGEAVTYFPGAGGASVPLQVNLVADGNERGMDDGQKLVEEITVSIGKDPAATTIGGILQPRIGDSLLRSATNDPAQRRYAWTGDVVRDSAIYWILRFARNVMYRQGGQTMERT